jgi:hypothetical protein
MQDCYYFKFSQDYTIGVEVFKTRLMCGLRRTNLLNTQLVLTHTEICLTLDGEKP